MNEKLEKMRNGKGFIAALDQSGGSTPKALKLYGVNENEYSNDKEMFEDLILTAVKDAMAKAEELAEGEMAKVTGGINIPGLF